MSRYLLIGFAMVAAMLVLLAGASGDFHSLPDRAHALREGMFHLTRLLSANAPDPAPAARREAASTTVPVADAPRRDVAGEATPDSGPRDEADESASQIARARQEIASLTAEADRARQDLASLRRQRQTEEASAREVAAANASDTAKSQAARQESDALAKQVADLQARVARGRQDLDSLSAERDRVRQDLASAQQQHQAAADANARTVTANASDIARNQAARQESDALAKQVADLQARVARGKQDLDSLSAERDRVRQDLASLQQQRQVAESAAQTAAANTAKDRAARDAARKEATDLQTQITRSKQELASAREDASRTRQPPEAPQGQREASLAAAPPSVSRPGPSAAAHVAARRIHSLRTAARRRAWLVRNRGGTRGRDDDLFGGGDVYRENALPSMY